MAETAVPVIHEITRNLGGTPASETVVPALKELRDQIGEGGIGQAVSNWLDDHPEATTTVQPNSITRTELNASVALTQAELAAILV